MTDKEEKQQKREARQKLELVRELHSAGNYRGMRPLVKELLAAAGDSEIGQQAKVEAGHLKVERWSLYVGAFATVLYALAWVVSLP